MSAKEKISSNNVQYSFSLQPEICVLESPQSFCHQTVVFEFIDQPPHNICIYIKQNLASKQCYSSKHRSIFNYVVNTDTSIELVIEDEITHKILGITEFKVTKYKPVRQRRRFSWNLL
ncbi:DUF3019 domain-containing protein [Litorilituus lipolyticus]|uniref:DUF3019 domain-containing protein n=1 Tax=Litorilituus lipolyticus TaxID=2491017 RepID=UPI001478179A|nr:DUF3019 domain-containing protein [Litorilituus lipolyticus]